MKSILAWRGLLAPLIFALAFTYGATYLFAAASGTRARVALSPPAERQDVYVLGNSMFGTGLDLEQLRTELPGQRADFGYYNGHYTSMWYLAATVGMDASNAPDTVVWGFRPTYAILPAFRQNKETQESAFAAEAPDRYRQILAAAGDPNAVIEEETAPQDETDVDQQVNFSGRASTEPFERFGGIAADLIKGPFATMNGEIDVLQTSVDFISGEIENLGYAAGLEDLRTPQGRAKPTDLLISYVTGGRIQRADALVVDNGERFVEGEKRRFDQSFIPPTAEAFDRLGARQIVVIFKPVRTFEGPMAPAEEAFYRDALAWFSANDIEVIDLIADPNLVQAYFASGDHYNQAGAQYVTGRIAAQVRAGN